MDPTSIQALGNKWRRYGCILFVYDIVYTTKKGVDSA